MQRQHQSQIKNALAQLTKGIASTNKENAVARYSTHPIEELQLELYGCRLKTLSLQRRGTPHASPKGDAARTTGGTPARRCTINRDASRSTQEGFAHFSSHSPG
jgi:hypothetical protein